MFLCNCQKAGMYLVVLICYCFFGCLSVWSTEMVFDTLDPISQTTEFLSFLGWLVFLHQKNDPNNLPTVRVYFWIEEAFGWDGISKAHSSNRIFTHNTGVKWNTPSLYHSTTGSFGFNTTLEPASKREVVGHKWGAPSETRGCLWSPVAQACVPATPGSCSPRQPAGWPGVRPRSWDMVGQRVKWILLRSGGSAFTFSTCSFKIQEDVTLTTPTSGTPFQEEREE